MSYYAVPKDCFVLRIPFGCSMTWKEILTHYPEIEKELDGSCIENCFLFYYEYSPVTGEYLFKDEDSENDLAEMFGYDFHTVTTGESMIDESLRKEQIKSLEDFLNTDFVVVEEHTYDKKASKAAKKERRALKLQQRSEKINV